METKKLDKQDTNEVEGAQITDKGLEMNPSDNLENSSENTLDKEYDAISDIQEKAEQALAELKQTQEEIEKIEYNTKSVTESINKVREQELGLPEETGEIPSLKQGNNNLKEYLIKKAKLIAFLTGTGLLTLANTGEANAQTNQTLNKNTEKKELKDYISNLESAGINIDNKTKIGLIGPDGKFVTMTTEEARNLANQQKEDLDTEPDNSKKDEVKKTTEIQSLLSKLINKGVVPSTMTQKDFQALSKAEVDFLYKEYAKKIGALTPEQMKKALEGKKVIEEITIKNALKVTEDSDVKEFSKILTPEQRSQEIKNIWKMEAQGKIKKGDSVTLSNGEVYVVKKYIPNTSKESVEGNVSGSGSASVETKFVQDHFKDKVE